MPSGRKERPAFCGTRLSETVLHIHQRTKGAAVKIDDHSNKNRTWYRWTSSIAASLLAAALAGCGGGGGSAAPAAGAAAGGGAAPAVTVPTGTAPITLTAATPAATVAALAPVVAVGGVTINSPPCVSFSIADANNNAIIGFGSTSKSSTATVAQYPNLKIDGAGHEVRLAFHLGPDVNVEFHGGGAILGWPRASTPGAARLTLPPQLRWSIHRGGVTPILGWYSRGLGQRVPVSMLLGQGQCARGAHLRTRLEFLDVSKRHDLALSDCRHTRRNSRGRTGRYHRCLLGSHVYSTMTAIPVGELLGVMMKVSVAGPGRAGSAAACEASRGHDICRPELQNRPRPL